MSDAKSPQDLSMDEILATIRRIIAEDERSSSTASRSVPAGIPPAGIPPAGISSAGISDGRAAGGPRETAQTPVEAAGVTDVLDLTDALDEHDSVRPLTPSGTAPRAPEPEAAPAPPPAETNSVEATAVEAKPAEAILGTDRPMPAEASPTTDRAVDPVPPPPAARAFGANNERLVSDVAALAAATAFGRLASAPRARREPPLVAGRPLDDIVRELLRPLLQTWLDENLPDLVERLVQAEIARISVRSGPG
jgi:cell pole-organizing protein PopZ